MRRSTQRFQGGIGLRQMPDNRKHDRDDDSCGATGTEVRSVMSTEQANKRSDSC